MWVLLLFEWKIMEYTYSAQQKILLHIAPVPQAALQAERPSDPARLPAGRDVYKRQVQVFARPLD